MDACVETTPRPGGRPSIGEPISFTIPSGLLAEVDHRAGLAGCSRGAKLREMVGTAATMDASHPAQQRIADLAARATGGHSWLVLARVNPLQPHPFDAPCWAAHLTGFVSFLVDGFDPHHLPAADPARGLDAPIGVGETAGEALEALEHLIRRITWGVLATRDGSTERLYRVVAWSPAAGCLVASGHYDSMPTPPHLEEATA